MLCKTQVEIEWRRKRRVLEFVVEKGTAKFRAPGVVKNRSPQRDQSSRPSLARAPHRVAGRRPTEESLVPPRTNQGHRLRPTSNLNLTGSG